MCKVDLTDVKSVDRAILRRKECLRYCDGCGNMKVNKKRCVRKMHEWELIALRLCGVIK